ncbi:MAG: flippase [Candidatus Omnitrophica bacterium]|nr:flippase [Candidatus Omnitrophota bacterium]
MASISEFQINNRILVRNILINFLGSAIYLLAGFIFMPIVIRYLGTERFGIFSLSWVILGYFTFFDLGLGRATTKFISAALGKGETEKVPYFLWNAIIFQAVLGIVGSAILIYITPFLVERILNIPLQYKEEARFIFSLVAFVLPVMLMSFSLRGALEAKQRFDLVNAVHIPSGISSFILPILGVVLGLDLKGIMLLMVASKIVTFLIWIWLCSDILMLRKNFVVDRGVLCSMFSFGGWLTVSALIIPAFFSLDRFIIGIFYTMAAVTYYTAPYEAVSRLWAIPGSLANSLFPAFSTLDGKMAKEEIDALFYRSIKLFIILIGLVAIPLLVFASGIMRVWLGQDFAQNSTVVFQILLLSFIFNCLSSVPYVFIQGLGRPDVTAKFNLLEFFLYIPLLLFLTKERGITGTAIAYTVRVGLDMFLLYFACWRLKKINVFRFSESGMSRALLILLTFVLAAYFIRTLPYKIYGLFIVTVIFSLLNWFYVLTKIEREWFIKKLPFRYPL